MNITDEWMAGFIEGDGCFSTIKNTIRGKTYSYPSIIITQKNTEPLLHIKAKYGGSISGPNINGVSRWSTSGKSATEIACSIYPFLSEKRKVDISRHFAVSDRNKDITHGLEWFAGFYEAEGCIALKDNGDKTYKYPNLIITQYYSIETMQFCVDATGAGYARGPYSAGAHGNVAYQYRVNGQRGIELLLSIKDMISDQKIAQLNSVIADSTLGRKRIRKLSQNDVKDIVEQYASGMVSYAELGDKYNVTQGRIGQIIREKKDR